MSRIGFWKNIFAPREKVAVDVGGKTHLLTHTQRYRLSELADFHDGQLLETDDGALDKERFSLEDAAARLRVPEDEVLARCAAGDLYLYVDMTGQSGHWCRKDENGILNQSTVATIRSGLLRLGGQACEDLVGHGRAIVRALDFCRVNESARSSIDDGTLEKLRAWGPGDKQFFPLHPLTIERDTVFLLPPLQ